MISTKALPFNKFRVTFILDREDPPVPISVVGPFNDWTPGATRLRNRADGLRSATVVVPAGTEVAFRYLADDGTWRDDPDVHDRDEHGNPVFTVGPA
ncbi:isoamylase [Actinokineospora sp. G85]|uniref:isoamylase n=1 Tax=Actinokineospora sp. G85 TaxID=3406626 RepID=UPI003C78A237